MNPHNAEPVDSYVGFCAVCGNEGLFEFKGIWSGRESYKCSYCSASCRNREQAATIVELYSVNNSRSFSELAQEKDFGRLSIYEPGIAGPFRKYFRSFPHYHQSYYWDDVPLGSYRNGIQNQDLMRLTFGSDMFDLMITADIFEHVRKPFVAFTEVRRVLKPGGMHVFTVPVKDPMPARTIYRVDTSGPEDRHLLSPDHHIAGDGGKALVYTEFGADVTHQLNSMGLDTHVRCVTYDKSRLRNLKKILTFYSIKVG